MYIPGQIKDSYYSFLTDLLKTHIIVFLLINKTPLHTDGSSLIIIKDIFLVILTIMLFTLLTDVSLSPYVKII